MNLFSFGADILKNVGNFLLPGTPFKTSSPISIVSTQPVPIGTTNTKTVSTYLGLPAEELNINSPFKIISYSPKNVEINTADVLKAPADYYLTSQARSDGSQGNIWDILGKVAGEVINTGFNVLTQKVNSPSYKTSPEVVYVPSAPDSQKSSQQYTYPTSPIMQYLTPYIQSAIDKILPNTANQPAQEGGITQTTSGNWLWIVIIGIATLFLLRRR